MNNEFREIRLRAIAFQELSNCTLAISPTAITIARPDMDGGFASFDGGQYCASKDETSWGAEFCDKETFITAIETWYGCKFPALMESQGWIELTEDSHPEGIVLCKLHDPTGVAKIRRMDYALAELTWAGPQNGWWDLNRYIGPYTHYKPI